MDGVDAIGDAGEEDSGYIVIAVPVLDTNLGGLVVIIAEDVAGLFPVSSVTARMAVVDGKNLKKDNRDAGITRAAVGLTKDIEALTKLSAGICAAIPAVE